MTAEQFAALKKGDTIRHRCAAEAMTVEIPKEGLSKGHMLVRRTIATNPDEWLLIGDDGHPLPEGPE